MSMNLSYVEVRKTRAYTQISRKRSPFYSESTIQEPLCKLKDRVAAADKKQYDLIDCSKFLQSTSMGL